MVSMFVLRQELRWTQWISSTTFYTSSDRWMSVRMAAPGKQGRNSYSWMRRNSNCAATTNKRRRRQENRRIRQVDSVDRSEAASAPTCPRGFYAKIRSQSPSNSPAVSSGRPSVAVFFNLQVSTVYSFCQVCASGGIRRHDPETA